MRYLKSVSAFLIAIMLVVTVQSLQASIRIKDITSIQGVRDNQLIGYGLVVGLMGTGDKSGQQFTEESFRNLLLRLGINVPVGTRLDSKNIAAVMVTTDLKAFMKQGQKIDVTVSSIGSAKSLRGGTLLMTPLKGANGKIYAVAQGNLVVGGLGATGKDGSKVIVNIPSVGRIPGGATVERSVRSPFRTASKLIYNLHRPDFTTAKRMVDVINRTLGPNVARALDASSIEVRAPLKTSQRVSYVAMIENLRLNVGQAAAKIIVNARTGTIVIGKRVQVSAAAITHGSLIVTISENTFVSQPKAPTTLINNIQAGVSSKLKSKIFQDVNVHAQQESKALGAIKSGTAVIPSANINAQASAAGAVIVDSSTISIKQEKNRAFLFKTTSLRDIVRAINAVGASPGDLVAILEALKEVGALHAELIII